MRRFLTAISILGAVLGGIFWFLLLASTSPDSPLEYAPVLWLNTLSALILFALTCRQALVLWREYKARIFGARLKFRLALMFALMAVLPGTLVYGVSVRFIAHSIDNWFDVRVEKALESGLALGRSVLDSQTRELTQKANNMAVELKDKPAHAQRQLLSQLREHAGVDSSALFSANGQLLVSDQNALSHFLPPMPSSAELKQARSGRVSTRMDSDENGTITLRVLVPISPFTFFESPQILQLTQNVPQDLAQNAEAVQEVYKDYQSLQQARINLTRIYAFTLTFTVLMALFIAFSLAFYLAHRLSAPLSILVLGTEAVAQGDFSPLQGTRSRDELGLLTRSFNQMTRQLGEARQEAERHRSGLESARAYLESILANISAGVLVFDHQGILRTLNEGAMAILDTQVVELLNHPTENWTCHTELGECIHRHFEPDQSQEWHEQFTLEGLGQTLLLRGSQLPKASGGGHVVVFDDITQLIAAQRNAAWGEVARRLAHEIKNPLTPIQLSAERLQVKLADRLDEQGREILERSARTIVNQVQAMKRMVDEFRDYSRSPVLELTSFDLNALIREVLGLYENSTIKPIKKLEDPLPAIEGDANRLRQVIHNLLKNGQDALEEISEPVLAISTALKENKVCLEVTDNGNGFPAEILPKVFEPYITTKPRGTGLGLPIVKKIVEEHHGSITISNKAEGGASISISLPLAKENLKGNENG